MPSLAMDFTNASIPDGWRNLFIEKAVLRQSKDPSKAPFIALSMNVDGGPYDGFKIQGMVSLNFSNQYMAANLKKFLEAATGVDWDTGAELQVEDDGTVTDVVSTNVGGHVKTAADNQGIQRTQVAMGTWCDPTKLPANEGEEEDDEDLDFDTDKDA